MHRTSNQHPQTSATKSPHAERPISPINLQDRQAEYYSNPTDNAQSNASNKQRQEPNIPTAPMLGTLASRDGARLSKPFNIPSSVSEPQTPVQQQSDPAMTPDPITQSIPKVRGAFWIITSPEPNPSEESWNNGQIKGKSLSTVIEEISSITNRDRIEKLKIRLKTLFAQQTTTVHKDAEDHWEIAKSNFEEKIREAFTRDRDQQVHFQIWIEPLYEQNAPMGGIKSAEQGEIDW
jgi:hypothetical protein